MFVYCRPSLFIDLCLVFYRREDGHGQQALQENHVGWKWSVPGVDESEAGQETERQADGKEKWPGQK